MAGLAKIKKFLSMQADRAFPVPFPYQFNDNLAVYIHKNDLSVNSGSITAWAIHGAYNCIKSDDHDGGPPMITLEDGKAPVALGTDWEESYSQKVFTKENFALASDLSEHFYAKGAQYFLDLVGASQTGVLDDNNLNSYFASTGVTLNVATIKKLLPALSAATTLLKDLPEFQQRILDLEWLKYHTSVSSGSGLVLRVLEATGTSKTDPGPFKVSPHIVEAVLSATKEPWNKGASDMIPMNLKGVCHVYLEALGMLPTAKWYQGEKGRSMLSPSTISAIKAYAVKTTAIKADSKGIEACIDVQSANAALAKANVIPAFI